MKFEDYRRAVLRTANPDPSVVDPPERKIRVAALGLAGEAGEVVDIVKKHLYHNKPADHFKTREEMGDLMWYFDLMASVFRFEMQDFMVPGREYEGLWDASLGMMRSVGSISALVMEIHPAEVEFIQESASVRRIARIYLSDIMNAFLQIGRAYDLTLDEILYYNVEKLTIRYPNGFNFEDANRGR